MEVGAACSRNQEGAQLSPETAAQLLENRNWMDRWPSDPDERLHVYRFTPSMGGGVYQDRTLFKGQFELFVYKHETSKLTIRWPDRKKSEVFEYQIEAVDGPGPFDLKLTLPGAALGPQSLYGIRAETPAHSVEQLIESAVAGREPAHK